MDRRTKATVNRDKAIRLQAQWGIDAQQVRYSDDGHWPVLSASEHFVPSSVTPAQRRGSTIELHDVAQQVTWA